jgi:hypothetical protein
MYVIIVKTTEGPRIVFPLERIGHFAIHHVLTDDGIDPALFGITHVPSGYIIPVRITDGNHWYLNSLEAARAWLELFLYKGGANCICKNSDGGWSMTKQGQGICKLLAEQVAFIDDEVGPSR